MDNSVILQEKEKPGRDGENANKTPGKSK